MANLTGDPFEPWVKTQVDLRQKSLGKYTDIPSQDLQFYTTKAPFLRLASSVNLTNIGPTVDGNPTVLDNSILKRITKQLGIPESEIAGSNLAKKFILQGGVVSSTGDDTYSGLQKGLYDGGSIFNGSYGWGGTQERGYIPMPGITDANVQYYNNGSLSKTIINVKLYSKIQFALFDVLYLRPGYTLLMEFGWSQYLDNETGNLVSMNQFYTDPLSKVLNANADTTQYEIYNSIKKERKKHSGNYEAVFGKISKFSWNFNNDGSYDCQIQLTSMGDIVESLKVNITDPNNKPKAEKKDEEEEIRPPLISNKNKTLINTELYSIYQSTPGSTGWAEYICPDFVGVGEDGKTPTPKDLQFKNGVFVVTGTRTDDENNESPQVFIKYGAFLAFIQSKILLYNKKDNSPLISFDMDFSNLDKDENVILKIPGQFSSDPTICLIPWTNVNVGETLDMPNYEINAKLSESSWEYSTYLGRISQILININYIASCLENAKSEDGNINLLDFLKTINAGIMQSLGGINSFEIKLDDENPSKLKFIENIPQRREDGVSNNQEYTRFNIYGVKPDVEGSFVKNLTFSSELSNNMAAMISIGAQANSNQISGNAVSFSNYSAGLIDRVSEDKLTSVSSEITEPSDGDTKKTIKTNFEENIHSNEESLFEKVYNVLIWSKEHTTNPLTSHNKTHANLILGELTSPGTNTQLQAPFFLPFNLNLEVDGLSGMRLYQKFLMTDNILPITYANDGVDLQIQGLNHIITPQSWTTKIDTLSTPAEKLADIKRPAQLSSPVASQGSSGGGGRGDLLPPPPGQQPLESEKLRVRLTRIMDDGTQTLGYMDVLDKDEKTILYTLATSELPWKNNQNSVSCIPVDKFRVKSHTSGKHGQCFWLIGNSQGNYAFDKLYGNGFIRSAVLIHMFPKAPGWALGCIGPGLKFNTVNDQIGRQKGTGTNYLDPAKAESYKALDKLLATLYAEGSFKMEIVNYGGVPSTSLPKSFNASVKAIAKSKNVL